MAAYAEGLNILHSANVGKQTHAADAETTPLRDPEHYQYDLNLPDITELWRRGSVIASWLLDLTANALAKDTQLAGLRRPGLGFGRRTLDDQGRDRRGRARAMFSRRRSTIVSPRAARPSSPTNCFRRCATNSAATSKSRPVAAFWPTSGLQLSFAGNIAVRFICGKSACKNTLCGCTSSPGNKWQFDLGTPSNEEGSPASVPSLKQRYFLAGARRVPVWQHRFCAGCLRLWLSKHSAEDFRCARRGTR